MPFSVVGHEAITSALTVVVLPCFFTDFSMHLEREMHSSSTTSSGFPAIAGAVGTAIQIFAVDRRYERFGQHKILDARFLVGLAAHVVMTFIDRSLAFFILS